MHKILIVVDAPGPADSIKPVIPLLREKAEVLLVTVKDSPYEILKEFNPTRCDGEEGADAIYHSFNPDILFVTTSSLVLGPFVVPAFTRLAHEDHKPIICFQDYWANHRNLNNFEMMKYWDVVLAQDELAKKFLEEDCYSKKIVITGNPALDILRTIDVPTTRARARRELAISDSDFLLTYIGRGTPQSIAEDEITFKYILEALGEMPEPPLLAIRPHPRDENPSKYSVIAREFGDRGNLKFLFPEITKKIAINDLVASSDAVIGMDSTSHIHAIYLRIPAICVLLPDAGAKRLEKVRLTDFPPNEVGASIGIYKNNPQDLIDTIERLRSDSDYRASLRSAQEKHFPLPRISSAENISQIILGIK